MGSLSELVATVLERTAHAADDEWLFRGHGAASFALSPSLYRRIADVGEALETESRVLLEFDNRARMVAERAAARGAWELLFLMQHHRVPTRLLDWSRNLLIAAFFAVHDERAWADAEDPPCVFVLNPKEWNTKVVGPAGMTVAGPSGVMAPSDTGTIASYMPRLTGGPPGPPQKHGVAIGGPEFAARIVAQRGAFIVFGTLGPDAAQTLEEQENVLEPEAGTLSKLMLDGEEADWRRTLALAGIGEFTAFPDLDGLARELVAQNFGSPGIRVDGIAVGGVWTRTCSIPDTTANPSQCRRFRRIVRGPVQLSGRRDARRGARTTCATFSGTIPRRTQLVSREFFPTRRVNQPHEPEERLKIVASPVPFGHTPKDGFTRGT